MYFYGGLVNVFILDNFKMIYFFDELVAWWWVLFFKVAEIDREGEGYVFCVGNEYLFGRWFDGVVFWLG